jgi:hypothetical protein
MMKWRNGIHQQRQDNDNRTTFRAIIAKHLVIARRSLPKQSRAGRLRFSSRKRNTFNSAKLPELYNDKSNTESPAGYYDKHVNRLKDEMKIAVLLQTFVVISLLILLGAPWLVQAQVNAPERIYKAYLPSLIDSNPATSIATPLPPGKIENPGFEQGLTGWWFHSSTANPIIYTPIDPQNAHSGNYVARLGDGEIGRKASIIQTLVIPTDKTKLNFWLYYESDDECGNNPDDLVGDYLSVYVENVRLKWVAICNPNSPNPPPTPAWELISIDVSAYQGAQIFLEVEFTSDVTIGSTAYVDDFAFVLP